MAKMYTVGELAVLLEVDEETVRRWRYRGRNGAYLECLVGQGKAGHRITAEALERFLEVNPGLMTEKLRNSLNAESDLLKEAQENENSGNRSGEVDYSLRTAQRGDSDTVVVLKSILDEKCIRREQLDREIRTLIQQIRQEQQKESV